jgi:N-acetylmuramoyl-L-alanine amidase
MRSKRKYTIILDGAHGCDVLGKRSADGSFLEWQWSREQLRLIEADLLNLGFTVTTSNNWADNEIGLSRRVANMNAVTGPAIVLSYHANACTMTGEGGKATGTVAYTTRGVTRSDAMADIFLAKIRQYFPDRRILRDISDGDWDFESNFSVLMSKWPSVLLEIGFMDNEDDLKLLKSEDWNKVMRAAIVEAIVKIDREV